MEITLDEERWQLSDETSVMEALAQLNDKAERKGRFVTSLSIGNRRITDRDLDPAFLSRTGKEVPAIQAISRSLRTIMEDAAGTMKLFTAQLKRDGEMLVGPLRAGRGGFAALDAWLGRLADYAEMAEASHTQGLAHVAGTSCLQWIQELVDARQATDAVRLADILEYELLPALIMPEGAH
ncbi:MAG TPA: hypothetical protein VHF07_04425 [Nitrospiraceae bacterium]|nr:hypothetical protein [Nitrospiraceae bacterium]